MRQWRKRFVVCNIPLNVVALDATQLVLQEERRAKEEIIANKQNIEKKSKEFIENQQKKMEQLNQAKVREYDT